MTYKDHKRHRDKPSNPRGSIWLQGCLRLSILMDAGTDHEDDKKQPNVGVGVPEWLPLPANSILSVRHDIAPQLNRGHLDVCRAHERHKTQWTSMTFTYKAYEAYNDAAPQLD
eukprot:1158760-Pelagomonas_calceolata.AAC.6